MINKNYFSLSEATVTGKFIIGLFVLNIFLSIFSSDNNILEIIISNIFQFSVLLPLVYSYHEKNIRNDYNNYISNIVVLTYFLVISSFFLELIFQLPSKDLIQYINMLGINASILNNLCIFMFFNNIIFDSLYFFNLYLKYKNNNVIYRYLIISLLFLLLFSLTLLWLL